MRYIALTLAAFAASGLSACSYVGINQTAPLTSTARVTVTATTPSTTVAQPLPASSTTVVSKPRDKVDALTAARRKVLMAAMAKNSPGAKVDRGESYALRSCTAFKSTLNKASWEGVVADAAKTFGGNAEANAIASLTTYCPEAVRSVATAKMEGSTPKPTPSTTATSKPGVLTEDAKARAVFDKVHAANPKALLTLGDIRPYASNICSIFAASPTTGVFKELAADFVGRTGIPTKNIYSYIGTTAGTYCPNMVDPMARAMEGK